MLPGVWRNAQRYKLGGTKLVGTQSKTNRKSRSTSASSYRAASMVTLTRGGQKMCALKQALRKATQKNITICRGKMWTAYDGVPGGKRKNLGRSNTSAMRISLLDVFPHSCLHILTQFSCRLYLGSGFRQGPVEPSGHKLQLQFQLIPSP